MKRQFIEQQMLQHAGRMAKNQSTIIKTLPLIEETIEETIEEVVEENKIDEEIELPKKKQKNASTEQ